MKKHAVFFTFLLFIIGILAYVIISNSYVFNEPVSTFTYGNINIEDSDKFNYKELYIDSDNNYGLLTLNITTLKKLDFLGIFKSSKNSLYLDSSNYYIVKLSKNKVENLIHLSYENKNLSSLVVGKNGDIYAHFVEYGKFDSWIKKEKIIHFDNYGKQKEIVFSKNYSEEDAPYLTGQIKNLSLVEDKLVFYLDNKINLTKYVYYKHSLKEKFSINLEEINGNVIQIYSDLIGNTFFYNSNSQIYLIDSSLNLKLVNSFLKEKLIINNIFKFNKDLLISLTDRNNNSLIKKLTINGTQDYLINNTNFNNNVLNSKYNLSERIVFFRIVFYLIFLFFILLVIYTCKYFYKYILQEKLSISLKMTLIIIPVIFIIMFVFVFYSVIGEFKKYSDDIKNGKYIQFNTLIDNQIKLIEDKKGDKYLVDFIKNIKIYKEIDKEKYKAFYSLLTKEGYIGLRVNNASSNLEDLASITKDIRGIYVVVDIVKYNEVYKILDTENNFMMFQKRILGNNSSFKKAKNGEIINAIGSNDNYIFTMKPIFDQSGKVIAIIQVGMKYAGYRSNVDGTFTTNSLKQILIVTLLLVFIIVFVLNISLRKLILLTKSVKEISNDNFNVLIDVTTNDEVGDLSKVFKTLMANLNNYINDMKELNAVYYKFVPKETIALIGEKDIKDVCLGDNSKKNVGVLFVTINNFRSSISNFSEEEIISFINKHSSKIGPIIRKNGGIIESYTDNGLIAIFPNHIDDGIQTSIEISREFNRLTEADNSFNNVSMFLTKGEVLFGIIGEQLRIQSTFISENIEKNRNLMSASTSMDISFMITKDVYKSSELIKTLSNIRYLGDLKGINQVYDVFESDKNSTKTLKAYYNNDFRKALEFFNAKEYLKARSLFVSILEKNINDGVARYFFYESDIRYRENR
ncbi:methyl-accepting chemotaxis protein [Helicovermis profundi]|uniref:HAMP domain-containing protein n=1 Tax=Helicovermis profundi TaxID=3065157 RepID=A0AAU9EV92_9FIRM|nr:hypothetical protein HLPR_13460 [Clostridia bacterium S502]